LQFPVNLENWRNDEAHRVGDGGAFARFAGGYGAET
jgi:hypothetical protein